MSGRTPIAFVINSIGQGGAERVLSILLAAIGDRAARYEVHLVLLDDLPHARPMPDDVVIHTLGGGGGGLFRLRRRLAQIRPALIVSFLVRANLGAALVGKMLGVPVIICERMHLSSHLAGRHGPLKRWAFTAALRLAYRFPALALGVSSGVTQDLVETFGVRRERSATLFNPYPIQAIRAAALEPAPIKPPPAYFVAVGRLEPSKNVLQLLEAYAAAGVSESLVIVGDGSLRDEVERRVKALHLEDRVLLAPFCANPFPIVAGARAYVSASLNEGFPNAMVEAMVLGRPVLASDCPSGPGEILEGACAEEECACEAEFGVLTKAGSLPSLIDGLRRMADPEVRERYGRQSLLRAADFAAEAITEQYWSLFERVMAGRASEAADR